MTDRILGEHDGKSIGLVFYSGSVSAISILTFCIVGVSLHPHDLVWYRDH